MARRRLIWQLRPALAGRPAKSAGAVAAAALAACLASPVTATEVWPPLHAAIRQDDAETVRLLLEAGADPNRPGPDGLTPLDLAVAVEDPRIVALLLKAGASPNPRDETALPERATSSAPAAQGMAQGGVQEAVQGPALWQAVRRGDRDTVSLLLDHGADANAPTGTGTTMLHEAVRRRERDIVALLVDAGADVTARDASGRTPLDDAVALGEKDITSLLLDAATGR